MPYMDEQTINWAVFEDGTEFLGMATATLPGTDMQTQEVSGAGISGSYTVPTTGHVGPRTLTLNFIQYSEAARKLKQPGLHLIDLRHVDSYYDPASAELKERQVKHVYKMEHLSTSGATIGTAIMQNPSGTYSVRSEVIYVDGTEVEAIDPAAYKYTVNGTDYLASHRNFLGR